MTFAGGACYDLRQLVGGKCDEFRHDRLAGKAMSFAGGASDAGRRGRRILAC